MTSSTSGGRPTREVIRRATAATAAAALAGASLVATSVAVAAPANAAEVAVTDATLTWGLNGYAQKGIFGPWAFKNPTGNTEILTGSVSGGSQTEYVVDPVPATSMPAYDPPKTPNAVKLTDGTGTTDPETGAVEVSWTGSYTVNAYPTLTLPDGSSYAPDEIFTDPVLTLDGDGNGALSMEYSLGPGHDQAGDPTPGEDLGRHDVLTFSEGSVTETSLDSFRVAPDYQGVVIEFDDGQGGTSTNTQCTSTNGSTGWWGSWPVEFVHDVPSSVQPHFYSTGCGGNQDLKPPLPVDIDLGTAVEPEVSVSDTSILPSGSYEVTVEGSGFDPSKAIGTRPPRSGEPAGTYVVFGKFAEVWKPSEGAPSSARKVATQQWALPSGGTAVPGTIPLEDDGTFETTLVVDKAAIDAAATDPSLVNYGIYTYPASGAVEPSFETYTPVTFAKAPPQIAASAPATTYGTAATVTTTVVGESDPTGEVNLKRGAATLGTATLTDGAASFTLPADTPAGRHPLTVEYAGDANTAAASKAVTLTVARAATRTKVSLPKRPTTKKTGKAQATVTSTAGAVTGKAKLTLRNAKGKRLKTTTVSLNGKGGAAFSLPRLAKGKYTLTVVYAGSGNLATSTAKRSFTVR